VKDEKGDLVADCHSVLARRRICSLSCGVYMGVSDVGQTEIHTAEPLVPEPNVFEVEIAIEKLKRHKSLANDQIPAKLIKARGRTICSEIHKLVDSIWNKEDLIEQWKAFLIVPIYKR
jgi:hypothetical protein